MSVRNRGEENKLFKRKCDEKNCIIVSFGINST